MTNNRCFTIRITMITALLLMLPLFSSSALAEICWGKVCSGSICCSGHGTCESFNNCVCDEGYIGKECGTPIFCGTLACDSTCGGHGVCGVAARMPSLTGTASNGLTCTATYGIAATCTGTTGLPAYGESVTFILNDQSGTCTYVSSTECSWTYSFITTGDGASCRCDDGYGGACCTFAATLAPAALDFGNVTGATDSASVPVTLTNPMMASALTLGTITLSGANSGDFSLGSGTCAAGGSVAAAGTCTVIVTFTPTAIGTRSATLTVTTVSPAVTLTTSLTGTGTVSADSIVVDPNVSTTLYAGLAGAGIYKSTNGGTSWTAATTQPSNTRIKAVVINKSDTAILYAATYGGGVFKSTNSGLDWTACGAQPANVKLKSLVMDGNGKLLAGTEAGVFLSADGCASWVAMNAGLP